MDQRRQPRPLLTRSTSLSTLRLKRLFSGVRPPPPKAITHLGAEFVVDLQQLRVSEAVHTPLLLSATTWIFTCRFCANARMEVDHPVVLHRFAHCVTSPHAHTPHVLRVLTLICQACAVTRGVVHLLRGRGLCLSRWRGGPATPTKPKGQSSHAALAPKGASKGAEKTSHLTFLTATVRSKGNQHCTLKSRLRDRHARQATTFVRRSGVTCNQSPAARKGAKFPPSTSS